MSKLDYVLDVGGSIVNGGTLNAAFLTQFKELIGHYVSKGATFGIIVGGGAITRTYQDFLRAHVPVDNTDLDMIGIRLTKLNAELVRIILKEWAYENVLEDPNEDIDASGVKVMVFSGWKPGWSTDYVAVLVAKRFGLGEVISLSNIKGVYEMKDGQIQPDKLIATLNWEEYEQMIGGTWTPGMRIPFDPVATKEAKAQGMTVTMLAGEDIPNVRKFLEHQPFVGTVIS